MGGVDQADVVTFGHAPAFALAAAVNADPEQQPLRDLPNFDSIAEHLGGLYPRRPTPRPPRGIYRAALRISHTTGIALRDPTSPQRT